VNAHSSHTLVNVESISHNWRKRPIASSP
jgi:hypothetical protein